jgi:hypothetical protein
MLNFEYENLIPKNQNFVQDEISLKSKEFKDNDSESLNDQDRTSSQQILTDSLLSINSKIGMSKI